MKTLKHGSLLRLQSTAVSITLRIFETNLGIAVWSGSVDPGADIKQYENTGAEDQQWKLEFVEYRGTGAERKAYYKIVNYKSQLSVAP